MARKNAETINTEVKEAKEAAVKEVAVQPTVVEAQDPVKPVIAKKPRQPQVKEPEETRYRLKALMNVRKKPSKDSTILSTKAEGTIVRVLKVEGDWLCLADGSYILYEAGKWAEKLHEA